jgi:RNA polymerase sigma-70 factor (ECF subfamily)
VTGVREENASYSDDAGPSDFQGGGQDKKSAWLAERFEEHRGRLRAVAYRMLGSLDEADDAVQETWLRLSRTNVSDVANLRAWLTTVVGRVALNMLESRGTRREDLGAAPEEPATQGPPAGSQAPGPEDEALLGEEVSAALQVVIDTLEPRERLAFVLHDLFAVPFDEIAPVVDTTSTAARQLASRARRRLRTAAPQPVAASLVARAERQREVVDAFFAAAREAQFAALLELLDPNVVLRADAVAARMGADDTLTGADVLRARRGLGCEGHRPRGVQLYRHARGPHHGHRPHR